MFENVALSLGIHYIGMGLYDFTGISDSEMQKLWSKCQNPEFFLGIGDQLREAILTEFKKRGLTPLGTIEVKFIGNIPTQETDGAGGWDIKCSELTTIAYGETKKVPTGLYVEVPHGYRLRLSLRSGMGSKGFIMGNAPALIDSDYRGEVCVIITNLSSMQHTFKPGDRIAQCWLEKIIPIKWTQVEKLSETKRGEKGFGSTGV